MWMLPGHGSRFVRRGFGGSGQESVGGSHWRMRSHTAPPKEMEEEGRRGGKGRGDLKFEFENKDVGRSVILS